MHTTLEDLRHRMSDSAYLMGEYATLKLGGDRRPAGWRRRMFRFPIAMYRWRLDGLISNRILLLRTVGRNTGKARVTPLEYLYDATADTYFLMAGWQGRTDWVRNIRKDPHVRIRVGRHESARLARILDTVESALVTQRWIARTPNVGRVLERDTGIKYRGTLVSATELASNYSVLALRPD